MSRCKACDRKMTEQELCRKTTSPITGKIEYNELCSHCGGEEDEYTEWIKRKVANSYREEWDENY